MGRDPAFIQPVDPTGSLLVWCYINKINVVNWQREDGMKLVRDAIAAGIFNDLGSGSNIDLCVITKDKVEYLRPYDEVNKKGVR